MMAILMYLIIGLLHLYYVEELVSRNSDKGYKTRPIWIITTWPVLWVAIFIIFIKGLCK